MKIRTNRRDLPVPKKFLAVERSLASLAASIVKLESQIKWRADELNAMKKKAMALIPLEEGKVRVRNFIYTKSHFEEKPISYIRKAYDTLRVRKIPVRPRRKKTRARILPAMEITMALLALFICLPCFGALPRCQKHRAPTPQVRISSWNPIKCNPRLLNQFGGIPRAQYVSPHRRRQPEPNVSAIPYLPLPGALP